MKPDEIAYLKSINTTVNSLIDIVKEMRGEIEKLRNLSIIEKSASKIVEEEVKKVTKGNKDN